MNRNNKYSRDLSPLVVSCVPLFFLVLYLLNGFSPTHDAISWQGAYHFYYSQVEKGIMPYWNPYSQTGTPFFVYYQSFGLLDPIHFIFIGINKITGCSTLTSYVLYYLSCYYVFVLGAYYTLRSITGDRSTSLLFSLILSLACCPAFFRQNGALPPFYLIPFITYCLLSFFKETDSNKKGLYLFLGFFFSAITINIHIASGLLFYVFLFLILMFLFKVEYLKETLSFVKGRCGLSWMLVSVGMFICMTLPVIALYTELHHENELFPTVRFLQKNENNWVRLYASDFLSQNVFGAAFTNNWKTSISSGNLLGLFFEPFQHVIYRIQSSEVKLFAGTFPLICLVFAAGWVRSRMVYVFGIMLVLLLLVMCNFQTFVVTEPSFFQAAISAFFPPLKMVEVYQNLGIPFLFCLLVVAAIGYNRIVSEKKSYIMYFAIVLFISKYFVLYRFWDLRFQSQAMSLTTLVIFFLLLSFLVLRLVMLCSKMISPVKVVLILLLLELLVFSTVLLTYHRFGSREYYRFMKNEGLLETKKEDVFLNSREGFLMPGENGFPHNNTFFGYEIFKTRKVAFPINLFQGYLKKYYPSDYAKYYIPFYDHFYTTTHYYDYLANIDLFRQLATSSVIFPIINFIDEKDVIFVKDKYEAARRINGSSIDDLGRYLFIEGKQGVKKLSYEKSIFFDSDNVIGFSEEDISYFRKYSEVKYGGNPSVGIEVGGHSVNHLRLSVDTPGPGYLFFGDGYSKHWKAFVDNKRARIEKANINFKSVFVPRGHHEILFEYDPVLFRYSLYLYFAGLFLTIAVLATYLAALQGKAPGSAEKMMNAAR